MPSCRQKAWVTLLSRIISLARASLIAAGLRHDFRLLAAAAGFRCRRRAYARRRQSRLCWARHTSYHFTLRMPTLSPRRMAQVPAQRLITSSALYFGEDGWR